MSFSIVLNPSNYYSKEGLYAQNVTYAYDFTNMPEGKYELTFSFRGLMNHLSGDDLALVYVNFGTSGNIYQAGAETSNKFTQFIGFLNNQYSNVSTDAYLYANAYDNTPIILTRKPVGLNIQVQILDILGQPFITQSTQPIDGYIMTLNFKKLD